MRRLNAPSIGKAIEQRLLDWEEPIREIMDSFLQVPIALFTPLCDARLHLIHDVGEHLGRSLERNPPEQETHDDAEEVV